MAEEISTCSKSQQKPSELDGIMTPDQFADYFEYVQVLIVCKIV